MSRIDKVPLHLLQIALPICNRYGLFLAGGQAMRAHGLVTRPSADLDLATGSSSPLHEIAHALAATYCHAGLEVEVVAIDARKAHLSVKLTESNTYRIDLLKEPLNKPATLMEIGPVLALEDAVGLKVGALHDRGLPRDLIDVHAAKEHFNKTELIALGRHMLDDEFSLEELQQQLENAACFNDDEFALNGIEPASIKEIKLWAQSWADEIGKLLIQNITTSSE